MTSWSPWFDQYLETYAACARGDREIAALLGYYAVPMLITSDNGVIALTSGEEVASVMQGQLDGLRASGYHHSDVLHAEVIELNSASALYRGTFSRRHRDGGEIACLTVTYLLTDGPSGIRISMLALHGG